ncbi:DoxX family protein [Nitrospirillum viridazoti]|uniref:Oxidoreductase n=1 Tax=Nitrospirillum amazonense TaxID=28077 RepID=A0A560HXH8_9PROT|nr:DoxX family protein [Nitrospirillum amazonense]TWB50651.1 putative oxidoreductase [Nitrospirillum amazonense]
MRGWSPKEHYSRFALGALRIVSGLLFLQHGMQKLFLWPISEHHPGPVSLLSVAGVAGILEFFGGMAVTLGLRTRAVAFVLSGEMAVAYWGIHFPAGLHMKDGFLPVVNQGDLAILFCFVFLYIFFAGPGAWSIEKVIRKTH